MGTTILFAVLFVVVVFIVDILYGIIDPRIRVAGVTNDETARRKY